VRCVPSGRSTTAGPRSPPCSRYERLFDWSSTTPALTSAYTVIKEPSEQLYRHPVVGEPLQVIISMLRSPRHERPGAHVKFQIKKTSDGQYRLNLVASNGRVLATSETYTRKQPAKDTIESIRKSAAAATVEDLAD